MRDISIQNLLDDTKARRSLVADLREGKIIAFPTDTVWGLAASATAPGGIRRIYEIKGRQRNKPLIALVPSWERVQMLPLRWLPSARQFLQQHWPGPLTAVLELSESPFPAFPYAALGVRMPNYPDLLNLLRQIPLVLLTTSANRSDHPPATTAKEVVAEFGHDLAWLCRAPQAPTQIASTVLDCSVWPPRLIRPGAFPLPPEIFPSPAEGTSPVRRADVIE